jgi:hypothetical protein
LNFRNISVVISMIFMSLFAASATAPGKVCEWRVSWLRCVVDALLLVGEIDFSVFVCVCVCVLRAWLEGVRSKYDVVGTHVTAKNNFVRLSCSASTLLYMEEAQWPHRFQIWEFKWTHELHATRTSLESFFRIFLMILMGSRWNIQPDFPV